jgi:hypothetical protein
VLARDDVAWTEDADALGLVRLVTGGYAARKPYRPALQDALGSYLNSGIEVENSRPLIEAATTACGSLSEMLSPHPLKPGFVVLPGKTRDDFIAALPSERSGPLAVGAMQRPTRAWTVDERPVGRDVTAPGRSCEAAFRTSKSVRSNDRSARNAIAPRRQPGRPLRAERDRPAPATRTTAIVAFAAAPRAIALATVRSSRSGSARAAARYWIRP